MPHAPEHPDTDGSTIDYPVVLYVSGRPCLVVGGGAVAARRAAGLMNAGARVTVVAPLVSETLKQLASRSEWATGSLVIEERPYQQGEAGQFYLVITATGRPEVDSEVMVDAAAAGVLGSSADRRTPSTVHLPAVHRQGPVTVAISTGGTSPALARWLRDRVAAHIPEGTALLATMLEEARAALQASGRPTVSVDWSTILDEVAPLVEEGRLDEARTTLLGLCAPPDRAGGAPGGQS